jgi:hypothetical protein
MAERFRIDLGFPALYASLSMDTTGITDGVVVYDKERQQLFYTGSYGGGGGGVAGVSSLEGLTGAIDLIAGSNITITTGSGTIRIDSTGGGGDGYWELISNTIVNSGSLDVLISSASLIIDQSATKPSDDIFLIKRQGVPKLKVNNQGVLTLLSTGSFPTAVTGGIIYKDNDFYLGYL